MCITAPRYEKNPYREIIEDQGQYEVNPFNDGLELCNFYEDQGYDTSLIILDLEMPKRDGPESAKWIRNHEMSKQKKRVPIIGLTGHESIEMKNKCLEAGMDKVLSKPISKADILNTIKSLV